MQIRLTKAEIVEKLKHGEKLRWVSNRVAGRGGLADEMCLYLGSDELDGESVLNVFWLEHDGVIATCEPDPYCRQRLEYELTEA